MNSPARNKPPPTKPHPVLSPHRGDPSLPALGIHLTSPITLPSNGFQIENAGSPFPPAGFWAQGQELRPRGCSRAGPHVLQLSLRGLSLPNFRGAWPAARTGSDHFTFRKVNQSEQVQELQGRAYNHNNTHCLQPLGLPLQTQHPARRPSIPASGPLRSGGSYCEKPRGIRLGTETREGGRRAAPRGCAGPGPPRCGPTWAAAAAGICRTGSPHQGEPAASESLDFRAAAETPGGDVGPWPRGSQETCPGAARVRGR